MHRRRNPRLAIYNFPDDISTNNLEEIILRQNPELNLTSENINPKFVHETKRLTRNMVIEFLISSFRRVQNVVCFLLGDSPASDLYMPTFRNTLSVPSSKVGVK